MSNLPESQMTARNGRTLTPDLTAEVAEVHAPLHLSRHGDVCLCGWEGHPHYAHVAHCVAAEVTKAVVTALGRPEVREVAHRAARKATHDLPSTRVGLAVDAALAAIPEALGAGEVDRG